VMKHLSEKFTEDEYDRLKSAKGDKSWHDFILESAGVKDE